MPTRMLHVDESCALVHGVLKWTLQSCRARRRVTSRYPIAETRWVDAGVDSRRGSSFGSVAGAGRILVVGVISDVANLGIARARGHYVDR